MTNTNTIQYKMVYKLDYAMKLIEMGHIVHSTMPNPKNNNFTVWIFAVDDTLEQDPLFFSITFTSAATVAYKSQKILL